MTKLLINILIIPVLLLVGCGGGSDSSDSGDYASFRVLYTGGRRFNRVPVSTLINGTVAIPSTSAGSFSAPVPLDAGDQSLEYVTIKDPAVTKVEVTPNRESIADVQEGFDYFQWLLSSNTGNIIAWDIISLPQLRSEVPAGVAAVRYLNIESDPFAYNEKGTLEGDLLSAGVGYSALTPPIEGFNGTGYVFITPGIYNLRTRFAGFSRTEGLFSKASGIQFAAGRKYTIYGDGIYTGSDPILVAIEE